MNTKLLLKVVLAAASLLATSVASSADGVPFCSETDLANKPDEGVNQIRSGHVSDGAAVNLTASLHFKCEEAIADKSICQRLIPAGTSAVELTRYSNSVCVALPGKRPLDVWVGWLPISRWQVDMSDAQLANKSWVGVWQNNRARLNIAMKGERLIVDGHAIWQGPAGPHFGEVHLEGTPVDGVLTNSQEGDESACRIFIRRVNKFIFAQDNGNCGASNVRFDGLYRFRAGLRP